MDPSIRPHKNKLSKLGNPGNETNLEGLPTGNSLPPSEKPSRASTLVRDMSDQGGSGNNYGKDIKDIPRYQFDDNFHHILQHEQPNQTLLIPGPRGSC